MTGNETLLERLRMQLIMVPSERPLILEAIKKIEQRDLSKQEKQTKITKSKE